MRQIQPTKSMEMMNAEEDALKRTHRLSNGVEMPLFGLGTFELHDTDELRESILSALRCGYTLIDTAQCYRNEAKIGKILSAAYADPSLSVQRESLFLVSKLHPASNSYEDVKKIVKQTLSDLGTSYLDLFLVHWPGTSRLRGESPRNRELRFEKWRAIQELYEEGVFRAIGVSNFTVHHLQEFADYCKDNPGFVLPMVNQIEIHPAWHPVEDIRWCREHNILVQAYSSLGRAELLQEGSEFLRDHSFLKDIAAVHSYQINSHSSDTDEKDESEEEANAHKRTKIVKYANIQQIFLAWAWQHGHALIPKSRQADRVRSNAEAVRYLRLTEEEMSAIDRIALPSADSDGLLKKVCWDPRKIT